MKKLSIFLISVLIYIFCIVFAQKAKGQNIGINLTGSTPNVSAGLDIDFSNKGLLIPRVSLLATTDVTTIATPATGLMVFNSNAAMTGGSGTGYYYYNGTIWAKLIDGLSGFGSWTTLGNAGTAAGTNFLGTTDNTSLDIRTNNNIKARFTTKGQIETVNSQFSSWIGEGAGAAITSGTNNSFLGYHAGFSNTSGYNNDAIGCLTLQACTTGSYNTAMGMYALNTLTSGVANTALGNAAGSGNNGSNNVFIGYAASDNVSTGSWNITIGTLCEVPSGTASNQLSIGNLIYGNGLNGTNSSVSTGNIGIGNNAPAFKLDVMGTIRSGGAGTDGQLLFYSEQGATDYTYTFNPNAAATQNVILTLPPDDGNANQVLTTDGSGNLSWTASGTSTSWTLTGNAGTIDGTNFIGTTDNVPFNVRVNNQKAGRIDPSGAVFLGYQAGNVNTAQSNTGIGYHALRMNTTGTFNTAVGYQALDSNTVGHNNTALGWQSLSANTTGYFNTSTGRSNLSLNTTGFENTANGYGTLYSNVTGSGNTAMGTNAMISNIAGSNATAIGKNAMFNCNNTTTPYISYCVAVGCEALAGSGVASSNTGNYNTAVGVQALAYTASGNNNTALGYRAGYSPTASLANITGSNNTFIGYGSGLGAPAQLTNATALGYNALVAANNSLVLGGTGADAVNVGMGITAPTQKLHVVGNVFADNGQYKIFNLTNDLYRSSTGKYGSANGFDFNGTNTLTGIVLEHGETESGGFYADGDMAGIWAPGDNDLLKLWDEDAMVVRARLDGSGNWYALSNNATSDVRLKKNIRPLPLGALEKVLKLNGKIYDWREEILFKGEIEAGKNVPMDELKDRIGFIAQELELIFPELVSTNKVTGMKAVNYDGMIPVLVEAMKDQQKTIESQNTDILALKAEMEQIKALLLKTQGGK